MKMKKVFWVFCLLIGANTAFGQIEISYDEDTDADTIQLEEAVMIPSRVYGGTEVIAYANWSRTNRVLTVNEGLFADTLGERSNELGLDIWSFGVGFRSQITNHLTWQGGIALTRNGETYDFQGTDTAFSYQTRYTYVTMPIKLFYTYGNRYKVYAGGGVIPQMFYAYRQDQQWTTTKNATDEETIKARNGYNSFVMSFAFNVGFQMYTKKNMSIFVEPEYRYQFINSYEKTDGLRHYGRAFGVNLGLTYTL